MMPSRKTPSHRSVHSARRRIVFEQLEDRRLLALGAGLLKDINTTPVLNVSSSPHDFVDAGNFAYFFASDPVHGDELWRTDGTAAGTRLIKDIFPGTKSSTYFNGVDSASVDGMLFFVADNDIDGRALWKSDGTAAGTKLVCDLNPLDRDDEAYEGYGTPRYLTNVNGTLFFVANDGQRGYELWTSDGTRLGTKLVSDIAPGNSFPTDLTNVNGTLFFSAYDDVHGRELWKSDGTAAGTQLVRDILPGIDSFYPRNLFNFGGRLLFSGSGWGEWQLWISDGTESGTALVKDSFSGLGLPNQFTEVDETVFFTASDDSGAELWRTDGTEAGTTLVKDIRPGGRSSRPSELVNVNGRLFFIARDDSVGNELWSSDGTAAGTSLVRDMNPSNASSNPSQLTNLNGTLLFSADDGSSGRELWRSNGTRTGTVRVLNIAPGVESSEPSELFRFRGRLLFAANDGTRGEELWRSDGTAGNTMILRDLAERNAGSAPNYSVDVNGILYFVADDGVHGRELWKTNGTSAGTKLVKDIYVGSESSDPVSLVNVNGTLFFAATDASRGRELWKSDGTAPGTVLVKNIKTEGSSMPSWLTNVSGTLFFRAITAGTGSELWQSNGTPTGTKLVRDIRPGAGDANPRLLTNRNGVLFFTANDGKNGAELWRSRGTNETTALVRDIAVGPAGSDPQELTNVDGTLFFSADGVKGRELWMSDGSTANTMLVKDIMPETQTYFGTDDDSYPANFVAVNNTIFFTASGRHGRELWRTDGTSAGTLLVKDIRPGTDQYDDPLSSSPGNLVNFNGKLFFAATNSNDDRELWKSDGTAAGTVLVKDINPKTEWSYSYYGYYTKFESSDPSSLHVANGRLFFMAVDEHYGEVPFTSDGTTRGTERLSDTIAQYFVGDPTWVASAGGNVFFAINHQRFSSELFRLTNVSPQITLDSSSKTYLEGSKAVYLADTVSVTDPDNSRFNGARLIIEIIANKTIDDILGFRGRNSVTVEGNNILRNGSVVARFTGGSFGGPPLEIRFVDNVSAFTIEAVMRTVTFRVRGDDPSTLTRRIAVTLLDGDGGRSASFLRLVSVVARD